MGRRGRAFRILPGVIGALALAACGGSGSSSTSVTPQPTQTTAAANKEVCPGTASANGPYSCTPTTTLSGSVTWSLASAPEGMAIQPRTGAIRWTPLASQTGAVEFSVVATANGMQQTLSNKINVNGKTADPAGIYVSPVGNDGNVGSSTAPLLTLQAAFDRVAPGDTIYLRGGEYRNAEYGSAYSTRKSSSFGRLTTSGTSAAPITVRNFANEYVRLKTDVTGIALKDVNYLVIDGLELEGNAQSLNEDVIMNQWWDPDGRQTGSRGIAGTFDHVTIRNSVIHDFPGAGISNDEGEFLTIEGNIVYDNAAWATGGVQGIALTGLKNTGASNEFAIQVRGNLVFGNQSLIISHVFSKGFVSLTVDEGHGILLQDTTGTFGKAALVENNLGLFNGKACVAMNTFDKATVRNNSCYMNSRVVAAGGEIVSRQSSGENVYDNLFHPRTDRQTFRLLPNDFTGFGRNATLSGIPLDTSLPPQTLTLSQVFANPTAGDFAPASGVPSGMGAPTATVQALLALAAEYGIAIAPPPQPFDAQVEQAQRVRIFATWSSAWSGLKLIDGATGYEWVYAQRCHYPTWPAASDCS